MALHLARGRPAFELPARSGTREPLPRRPARRGLPARLRSPRLRVVRFALTGAAAGLLQIGALHVLERLGAAPLLANALGFLVAAQVNFLLSQAFTWGDRAPAHPGGASIRQRWLRFHAAIAGAGLLNLLVFAFAQTAVPDVPASLLGIAAAAGANFLLGDRVVFRPAARPFE